MPDEVVPQELHSWIVGELKSSLVTIKITKYQISMDSNDFQCLRNAEAIKEEPKKKKKKCFSLCNYHKQQAVS